MMLGVFFLLFALVLFIIAGVNKAEVEPWRSRLISFGLACVTLALLVDRVALLK